MKDFTNWNNLKQSLNELSKQVFFHERQIWYCHLGLNIGYELDGKNEDYVRPVIIFRKFNKNTFLAIPLTSQEKITSHYFAFRLKGNLSFANTSQLRLIDSKRLIKRIGTINRPNYRILTSTLLKNLLKIKLPAISQGAEAEALINLIKAKAKYVLIVNS